MNGEIVIVEDQLLIAKDMQLTMKELGYKSIIGITTVDEAIDCIEKVNPILVLIDINLNTLKNGTHIGKYLLQKQTIPYIYVTSYSDKKTLNQVNATRPHGYIVKPFKDEDLKATISIVLNNFNHKKIDTIRNHDTNKDPIPFRIRKVVNFINDNLHRKIENAELAALTEWKQDHLIRLFSKYLKVTPYQYILSKKIEKAKALLQETTIPINEIAFELGFESSSNFYKIFKKKVNDSPLNFRKRYNF